MSKVANTPLGGWKACLFSDQQFEATERRRCLAAFRYDMDRALSAGSAFVFMSLALTSRHMTGKLIYPLIPWLFAAFGIIMLSESVALALIGKGSPIWQWVPEVVVSLFASVVIILVAFLSTIIHGGHIALSMSAVSLIMVVMYLSKFRSGKLFDRINHELSCQEAYHTAINKRQVVG
ncbi:MAG: hypothetical protein M1288_03225 [Actinobacteria bacterium]|nr:hypothetical protein [Actinomycetota bacterium]